MIKKSALALAIAMLPAIAFSDDAPVATNQPQQGQVQAQLEGGNHLYLQNVNTGERKEFTLEDARKPEALVAMLPAIDGVHDLFNAYLEKGYTPFHAYVLTNADIVDVLKKFSSDLKVSNEFSEKVNSIRNLYQEK